MIFALAITGVTLIALFAAWMFVLFVSMAFADNGYVGKHRGLPDPKPNRSGRPDSHRSYHRTLGGRAPERTSPRRDRRTPVMERS
ncbi:hypothetical protein [Actinomadura violacea]|uniref:Secreted protein n=1 Tax=Actinomadura violacea TaxID=2819934 RepID=A0ABS3RP75_9ACTN|nr:hypothetical protein [Actinomadura violacea]MBO2458554.1 hypothetical protein [Actinomadura violacea]